MALGKFASGLASGLKTGYATGIAMDKAEREKEEYEREKEKRDKMQAIRPPKTKTLPNGVTVVDPEDETRYNAEVLGHLKQYEGPLAAAQAEKALLGARTERLSSSMRDGFSAYSVGNYPQAASSFQTAMNMMGSKSQIGVDERGQITLQATDANLNPVGDPRPVSPDEVQAWTLAATNLPMYVQNQQFQLKMAQDKDFMDRRFDDMDRKYQLMYDKFREDVRQADAADARFDRSQGLAEEKFEYEKGAAQAAAVRDWRDYKLERDKLAVDAMKAEGVAQKSANEMLAAADEAANNIISMAVDPMAEGSMQTQIAAAQETNPQAAQQLESLQSWLQSPKNQIKFKQYIAGFLVENAKQKLSPTEAVTLAQQVITDPSSVRVENPDTPDMAFVMPGVAGERIKVPYVAEEMLLPKFRAAQEAAQLRAAQEEENRPYNPEAGPPAIQKPPLTPGRSALPAPPSPGAGGAGARGSRGTPTERPALNLMQPRQAVPGSGTGGRRVPQRSAIPTR